LPTLNWIGKEAVVNHDKEVPFRLLKKIKSTSVGDNSQNLIIHGDNLEALKALMPYYQGRVKCIYIDPPYNTGNESWVYNDKVNSPKIKKWLGKVVGGESEDLCRHDKWLCMMYPRLKLLRDLLSEDGVIFVSIDDNEQGHLRELMDELFLADNFIAQFIWHKKSGRQNDAKFVSNNHEYILCFSKNIKNFVLNKIPRTDENNKEFRNWDDDLRGVYIHRPLHAKSGTESSIYEITFPNGVKWKPPIGTYPRFSKEKLLEMYKDNRIWFGKDKKNVPRYKRFLDEVKQGIITNTLLTIEEVGSTQKAKEDYNRLGLSINFDNPKSIGLIKYLTLAGSNEGDVILDSFAGSGTTAHAILELNKENKSNRKFILIEMEDYAKNITAERVKRAIDKNGYKDGFEYCELDKPLFDEDGKIDEDCSFEQLATYVYFTETNTNLDKKLISGNNIGDYNDVEYYLLYKEKGRNVLNKDFLKKISKNSKKKIVYADKCLIDDITMGKYNLQFKQIPYEVKVY
jgi:adenine-specific DNA-methyltransferase